jgi:hypothetical protein
VSNLAFWNLIRSY